MPVKRLATAKTRLAPVAGVHRRELALAMALDTIAAALACPLVSTVVVVTDDTRARAEAAGLGALVMGDLPDAGLNPALAYGAEQARAREPEAGIAALAADLPALRPADLAAALEAAQAHAVRSRPRTVVSDADGSGTVLLTAAPGVALAPAFGRGSLAAHVASGAVELAPDALPVTSLRRDVDTELDLREAARLGVGRRSASVLAAIG